MVKDRGMSKSTYDNWEDIVFEYRNKDYGAYLLRHNYPFYKAVSALIVILVFLSFIYGLRISKGDQGQVDTAKKVVVLNYNQLQAPPPIEKVYTPPREVVAQPKKVEKYAVPEVIKEEVKEEDEMMTIEEVKENLASTDNSIPASDGIETTTIVEYAPPPIVEEVKVEVAEKEEKAPAPVNVTRDPEFPGGNVALKKWLRSHLDYPAVAKRMGVQGTVGVQFTISEKGKILDVTVVKGLHKKCDEEAIRLARAMPDWKPGEIDGVKAAMTYVLAIPFSLD
jgi:periplasmic protein TonB